MVSLLSEPECGCPASQIVSLNDYQVDEACRRTVFYAFKVALTNIILVSYTQLYEERKWKIMTFYLLKCITVYDIFLVINTMHGRNVA